MTREEHLAWAKQRALEYLDRHDVVNAVASMISDLGKHDELKSLGLAMGPAGMMHALRADEREVRRWIEGFQ